MFFNKLIALIGFLVVVTNGKQLRVKNLYDTSLSIEVTNQDKTLIDPGQELIVEVAVDWVGRVVARPEVCQNSSSTAAACTAPATLSEFALFAINNLDMYDISLVDGFNYVVKVVPVGNVENCEAAVCQANINAVCPVDKAVKNELGEVVACKNTPELFDRVCPLAINTPLQDNKVYVCNADAYLILFG